MGEGTRLAAATGAWICFEDETGQTLAPPKARTWARRGRTPVITVTGRSSGRLSVAGMVCLRPGEPGRFFYRIRVHGQGKDKRRSLSEADYAQLITAAHTALDAPLILIWDNLNTHLSTKMRSFTDASASWLTVLQLPAYAPELNAAESAWAYLKTSIANLAPCTMVLLTDIIRSRLHRIQRRPDLITGFLGQTGLKLEPEPP